jgi:PKD repeat protein
MVETEDGFRRYIPGPTGDVVSGYSLPWYMGAAGNVLTGATTTFTFTIADADFVYYIDSINVTPQALTQFVAVAKILDVPYEAAAASGQVNLPMRNNPSIFLLDTETIKVDVTNLDASTRTFLVKVHGSKIAKTVGFGRVPSATFSADILEPNPGETVTFTDASTQAPTSWDWDFGDGSPHSSLKNPTHVYSLSGSYDVTLIATNQYGYDTHIHSAYIVVSDKQHFLTYTEVDPNSHIAISDHIMDFTGMTTSETCYVYKDLGADYFDAIDVRFAVGVTALAVGNVTGFIVFANSVGTLTAQTGYTLCVYGYGNGAGTFQLTVGLWNNHVLIGGNAQVLAIPYAAYCRLVRAAGSTTVTLYVYTDASYSTILYTIPYTVAGMDAKFRYLYGLCSYNEGSAKAATGYIFNYIVS